VRGGGLLFYDLSIKHYKSEKSTLRGGRGRLLAELFMLVNPTTPKEKNKTRG
jgi:hypothetical protein